MTGFELGNGSLQKEADDELRERVKKEKAVDEVAGEGAGL